MVEFDMRALQAALDGERRARKLTWDQLAAEISEPFKITPSIPVSVSTLRAMTAKRLVLSDLRPAGHFNEDQPPVQRDMPDLQSCGVLWRAISRLPK